MSTPIDPDNRPKVGQQYKKVKTGKVYTVEKSYTYNIILINDIDDIILNNSELTTLLANGTLIRI